MPQLEAVEFGLIVLTGAVALGLLIARARRRGRLERNELRTHVPYAVTILISAFLLFQVEPIIAKIILPWFGGSAAVWTTCLLFF